MAEAKDLPREAQEVLSRIIATPKTVFVLVDELGWSQTEVQRWLNALDKSGWVDKTNVPDGSPSGGSAIAYKRRPTGAPAG